MAKKQAQRQAKAEAEALASGMGKPKSKKNQRSKLPFDKGLSEDSGAFKQGVLRVGQLPKSGGGKNNNNNRGGGNKGKGRR